MQSPKHDGVQPVGAVRRMTATAAQESLLQLIADTNEDGIPIHITSSHGNAVIVSEDAWNALQETLHLSSIPGMVERLCSAAGDSADGFISADEVDL